MKLKPAKLRGDAFLEDVRRRRQDPEGLHIWWLGQSGFLVCHAGRTLLIDPYLSDSLTRKYADTDKPHVRMTEQVIEPGRLEEIDLVTSSHNHTDHLDGETLTALREANADMVTLVPAANRAFAAERLQVAQEDLAVLDAGERSELAGIVVHAVPAAHEKLETDEKGRHKFLGYVFELGDWKIYHSGDTMLYDGMVECLQPFSVDVAILPINGRAPERRVAGNLFGDEAARLAAQIEAEFAVPCHYDMFEFNTAAPELFETTCRKLEQRYRILQNGEGWTLER